MTNMIKDTFETLDYQYQLNTDENDAVEALNRLPADERNLMILYIECNAHYTEVARKTHLSVQTIKEHVDNIKEKLKDELTKIQTDFTKYTGDTTDNPDLDN